jgi:hypothetical protein
MSSRIQLRRSPAGIWASTNNGNIVLQEGEPGYETDTKKLKIGDGSTPWATLPYFNPPPTKLSELDNDVGFITSSSLPTRVSDLENDLNYVRTNNFQNLLNQSISPSSIANWNTAFSWGNHATAGYLTTSNASSLYQTINASLTAFISVSSTVTTGLLRKTSANTWTIDNNTYLTSADLGGVTPQKINNWDTAFSWGDHGVQNYIRISTADGRYQSRSDVLTNIAALQSSSSGYLRKEGTAWVIDSNTFLTTSGAAATYQTRLSTTIPTSSTASGTAGQIAYDSNFIYICVNANTWRRAAILPW